MEKTNVMRILDENNIEYIPGYYNPKDFTTGLKLAELMNLDPNEVFKTIVTIGKSKNIYVFVVAVKDELDFKKCANLVSEKHIEMVHQKDLFKLTGYIHGACSPLGMKKNFKTIFDDKVNSLDKITFSGGKLGTQVTLKLHDLDNILDYSIYNIRKDN